MAGVSVTMMPMPVQNDPNLFALAVAGDRSALEAVARQWWPSIRRWSLYILGDEALAEDGSQEALILLMRNIHMYDPTRPFGPWLKTLTRNACLTVQRRTARHDSIRPPEVEGVVFGEPEQALDDRRRAQRAVRRFEQLPQRQREVMALCTLEGLSAAAAARELGIAAATARVLLHRARQTLRNALGEKP